MISHGAQIITDLRRGTWQITSMTRGTFDILYKFSSPYSTAATAALKAQFPTQWPTIKAYGFVHPEIVPFINEDPMLVMSLIEGLGTRWLVGDGNSWIDSGHVMNGTDKVECIVKDRTNPNITEIPFGVRQQSVLTYSVYMSYYGGQIIDWYYNNNGGGTSTYTSNSATAFKLNTEQGKLYIDGVQKVSRSLVTNETTINYFIMAQNANGSAGGMLVNAKVRYLAHSKSDNTLIARFVPFISQEYGAGMLDIVSLEFHENKGSGSFTISETPAS